MSGRKLLIWRYVALFMAAPLQLCLTDHAGVPCSRAPGHQPKHHVHCDLCRQWHRPPGPLRLRVRGLPCIPASIPLLIDSHSTEANLDIEVRQ
jgi:hypothetical protein